jgi:DNA replication ATP-dependent helicase Dna2
MQAGLRAKSPNREFLQHEAKAIVQRNIDGLYSIGGNEREALEKLIDSIPTILGWLHQFCCPLPLLGSSGVEFSRTEGNQPLSIPEVVDIEEMVWSPKYGLKGMIDASVQVRLGHSNTIMPLELKTGKGTTGQVEQRILLFLAHFLLRFCRVVVCRLFVSISKLIREMGIVMGLWKSRGCMQAALEHRAQVILYTLLMSDRYMQDVGAGLLFYLHTNQTQGVGVRHADLAGIMIRRNDLATNLLSASSTQLLPPMLKNEHICRSCRHLDVCTVYHKVQPISISQLSS